LSAKLRFFVRRLLMLAATLLVSSFVIFGSLYLAPGNPIAVLSGGRSLPPDAVKILEARYHLDQPFLTQYWIWLTNALHGDFGISILLRENVSTLIAQRAGGTAALVLYAAILIVIFGVGLGLVGGLRPGWVDTSVIVTSAVSAALPSFVAAIVLIIVFSVGLGWFPSLGSGQGLVDGVYHLTLPALALAASSLAIVARVTRASVREEFGREHVQTAISRGIPYPQLVRRHVLRNASIPITTVTGVTIASLIAGAAVVERAFGLNGLGAYLVSAANSKDFAVVQGICLVLVTTFVIVNLVVDLLYAALDPRISLGSRAR
jgi:peptide/nickel transport system permease protein